MSDSMLTATTGLAYRNSDSTNERIKLLQIIPSLVPKSIYNRSKTYVSSITAALAEHIFLCNAQNCDPQGCWGGFDALTVIDAGERSFIIILSSPSLWRV